MSIERAILVGAGDDRHLGELNRLVETLGITVVGSLEQNRRDGAGYLGTGKREELSQLFASTRADCVVADDELTASQARTLERSSGPVVDRTELIIRIFEAHASDSASRLEVELADLEYGLPRIKGHNTYFSRLGGGGVTKRGPGEQQLEYDRRTIRRRMGVIRKKLEGERKSRKTKTSKLRDGGPYSVALVGYTNAGKTTILNALSGSERSTEDRLFGTLETTTRSVTGESHRPDFVVSDTVGFIRKLPTQLVHSFASTLEIASEADILVLCADSSSENIHDEIKTVKDTLESMMSEAPRDLSKRMILCLNKSDLLSENQGLQLGKRYDEAVLVSAVEDVSQLRDSIYEKISYRGIDMSLLIPHSEYEVATALYGHADIKRKRTTEQGTLLQVTIPKNLYGRYAQYQVKRH
ncbi:GTPase HflX [soil metagenome]